MILNQTSVFFQEVLFSTPHVAQTLIQGKASIVHKNATLTLSAPSKINWGNFLTSSQEKPMKDRKTAPEK